MNRVDRLMAMVLQLQGRRVVRAEDIAAHFEISVRTVYRDLGALGEAGVPIVAEAGVGNSLVKGYHLPPVMFTELARGIARAEPGTAEARTPTTLSSWVESEFLPALGERATACVCQA